MSGRAGGLAARLFDEGWTRIPGGGVRDGRRLSERHRQMIGAARGGHAAVFKLIKGGATSARVQLRGQLAYLTEKSTQIIDPDGTFDGRERLTADAREALMDRFDVAWRDAPGRAGMARSAHLLFSFPVGTRVEDASAITREVCEEMLRGENGIFDYVAAVHDDRDHPHVHVVVNRRALTGELFYLARDHALNYDAFREAMVREGALHGVRLEATRRVERGILTYRPSIEEIHAAKRESRAARDRIPGAAALERLRGEVRAVSEELHWLRGRLDDAGAARTADAIAGAARALGGGRTYGGDGGVYMAEADTIEDRRLELAELVRAYEARIEAAEPERRPAMERQLYDALDETAQALRAPGSFEGWSEPPTRAGPYSESNARADADALSRPELRASVADALRGTGIDDAVVLARAQTGARNAALEARWMRDDAERIARTEGIDLSSEAGQGRALDRLMDVHARVGRALRDGGALRERAEAQPPLTVESYRERARESDQTTLRVLLTDEEGASLRRDVVAGLDDERLDRLLSGDADALGDRIEDRVDRLRVAQAWLSSQAATAQGPAIERVERELAAELRERAERDTDGAGGLRH